MYEYKKKIFFSKFSTLVSTHFSCSASKNKHTYIYTCILYVCMVLHAGMHKYSQPRESGGSVYTHIYIYVWWNEESTYTWVCWNIGTQASWWMDPKISKKEEEIIYTRSAVLLYSHECKEWEKNVNELYTCGLYDDDDGSGRDHSCVSVIIIAVRIYNVYANHHNNVCVLSRSCLRLHVNWYYFDVSLLVNNFWKISSIILNI